MMLLALVAGFRSGVKGALPVTTFYRHVIYSAASTTPYLLTSLANVELTRLLSFGLF
jgi:hypothetical protein